MLRQCRVQEGLFGLKDLDEFGSLGGAGREPTQRENAIKQFRLTLNIPENCAVLLGAFLQCRKSGLDRCHCGG